MSKIVDQALGRASSDGRWQTDFGRWVSDFGASHIVEELSVNPELRVTQHAVYEWLRGHAPRFERAEALVRLSRGRLSLEDIYSHAEQLRCQRSEDTDEGSAGA